MAKNAKFKMITASKTGKSDGHWLVESFLHNSMKYYIMQCCQIKSLQQQHNIGLGLCLWTYFGK